MRDDRSHRAPGRRRKEWTRLDAVSLHDPATPDYAVGAARRAGRLAARFARSLGIPISDAGLLALLAAGVEPPEQTPDRSEWFRGWYDIRLEQFYR